VSQSRTDEVMRLADEFGKRCVRHGDRSMLAGQFYDALRSAVQAMEDELAAAKGEGLITARAFHEAYERLAPQFGYETRAETREFDPESPNGKLMIAVCRELAAAKQGEAVPAAWCIPETEQFTFNIPPGERPFAKAWKPLFTHPAPVQEGWPKLDKPAHIGTGSFGKGVSAQLVIEAAQRLYEMKQREEVKTDEQLQIDEANRRALWDMIHGAPSTGEPK
jgi:hypothetical protein